MNYRKAIEEKMNNIIILDLDNKCNELENEIEKYKKEKKNLNLRIDYCWKRWNFKKDKEELLNSYGDVLEENNNLKKELDEIKMKREKFEKETELYKKNNSLMINNEIIFSKIIILLINLKSNQISKFITDAKNKWFIMFKLSFKDVNNENQANEIIDKSYYNLSLSMNKVLNLEEEVICDFEISYFYDVNNLKIYEIISKVEIYTYISNQFYNIYSKNYFFKLY